MIQNQPLLTEKDRVMGHVKRQPYISSFEKSTTKKPLKFLYTSDSIFLESPFCVLRNYVRIPSVLFYLFNTRRPAQSTMFFLVREMPRFLCFADTWSWVNIVTRRVAYRKIFP